jgi:hypothetical protein
MTSQQENYAYQDNHVEAVSDSEETVEEAQDGTEMSAPQTAEPSHQVELDLKSEHTNDDQISSVLPSSQPQVLSMPQEQWLYLNLLQQQLDLLRAQFMHFTTETQSKLAQKLPVIHEQETPRSQSVSIGTNTTILFPGPRSEQLKV